MRSKFTRQCCAGLLLVGVLAFSVALASVAFAQDASPAAAAATVPIGDWITAGLEAVRSLAEAGVALLVARYGPPILSSMVTDKEISAGVNLAIATIEGAAHGQVWTLPVANSVIVRAEEMVIAKAPIVAKILGAKLRPVIIAHLSGLGVIPAEAHAGNLAASLPRP